MANPIINQRDPIQASKASEEAKLLQKMNKEIAELFKNEKIDEYYTPDVVQILKEKLGKLCTKKELDRSGSADAVLRRFKNDILPERKKALRQHLNVKRQKKEILQFELNPGKVDIRALTQQLAGFIPYTSQVVRWNEKKRGYDINTGSSLISIFGADDKEMEHVKNIDLPIVWTTKPDPNYRNSVMDALGQTRDRLKINDEELRVLLDENGRSLTAKEIKDIKITSPARHRFTNLLESCGSPLLKLSQWAGKGIISKSKVFEDPRIKHYWNNRNESLVQMLQALSPNSRHLETLKAALAKSGDILDQATFLEIQQKITDEIKKEASIKEKELNDFNEKCAEMNQAMLEKMKGVVQTEDEMWKHRILQVFLMMSPFAAFSVAGGIFNYLDPFKELLGPLFDGSISTSEGIASMTTSSVFGPFSEVTKALKVDTAVKWMLDEVPVVKHVCQIFDALTDNDVAQGFFKTTSPFLSSPVIPLGIALLHSGFRIDNEITHYQKTQKMIKEEEGKSDAVITTFVKNSEAGARQRAKAFAGATLETQLDVSATMAMCAFVVNANEQLLRIFDNIKIPASGGEKKLSELKKEGQKFQEMSSSIDFYKFLRTNPALKKALNEAFLVHLGVCDQNKSHDEDLKAFNDVMSDPAKKATVIREQREELDQAYIAKRAQQALLSTPKVLPAPKFDVALAQFVTKADEKILSIFDEVKIDGKTLAELKKEDKLPVRPQDFAKTFLALDKTSKAAMRDSFALFEAVKELGDSVEKRLENYNEALGRDDRAEVILRQKKTIDESYILDTVGKKTQIALEKEERQKLFLEQKRQLQEQAYDKNKYVAIAPSYEEPGSRVAKPVGQRFNEYVQGPYYQGSAAKAS